MASAVARAYNGGGVQKQSPWSGAKAPWSWKLFGFWTSNVSSKICLIRLTCRLHKPHVWYLTTMAWTISDIILWVQIQVTLYALRTCCFADERHISVVVLIFKFNVTASNYIIKAINQSLCRMMTASKNDYRRVLPRPRRFTLLQLRSCRHPVFEILSHLTLTLVLSATVFEILTFKARKWLILPTLPLFDSPVRGNPLEFSQWNLPCKN